MSNTHFVKKSYRGPSNAEQLEAASKRNAIDSIMGFDRYDSGPKKTGWLINVQPTIIATDEVPSGAAACDFYFLDEEGGYFKTTVQYEPYFYVVCSPNSDIQVEEALRKLLDGIVKKSARTELEDLSLPNHLVGLKRPLLKLSFNSLTELLEARNKLRPVVAQSQAKQQQGLEMYYDSEKPLDALDCVEDIKEYDVPYNVRVCIDKHLRVGKWYTITANDGNLEFLELDTVVPADPVVLAFDIETTKAPLKFPDASFDQVMMISYMIDGEGFLITNREIISEDIEDFEYTPKPEYPGEFQIFNEKDEKAVLLKFFEHVREVKPTVIATFNGDFFDWPFIDKRATAHGISMYDEIGFQIDSMGEYKSSYCAHMDCFRWVKRDSYLPQGSQGLKAVTRVKLGYNPLELDPELMTPYAMEKPQILSEYSVSDAVATYYLYYKYVHPFIFSLATIIPLNPDDVLRKGTGTLCEMLLMVQAYQHGILLPNKHTDPPERFYSGHLLETETYVGGHVESLEAGVFRSDLPSQFRIDPSVIDELVPNVRKVAEFFVTTECGANVEDVTNMDSVVEQITQELRMLQSEPSRNELPQIYHVDVASMYPNIMISNRLQPDSIKTEHDCAACDYNRPGKQCARDLVWAWRGEYYPAKMDEYAMVKRALQNETFPPKGNSDQMRHFSDLSYTEQAAVVRKRVQEYSRKVYHRIKVPETVERTAVVCQRENPFYINTVKSFRDRRYHYKGLAKDWKKKAAKLSSDAKEEANKMVITYDSLQLAHKVILNSFYGYVMRKGSRWYSMEMAGITCLTGSTIIQMARALIERFGRPLELDTDGIWCIIPKSFPDEFQLKLKNGKSLTLSYLCSMLNELVHQKFTNHQYQELVDGKYEIKSENSIFFELDGPYKAMILPTSKEEGKGLKKRYAVFNFDGSLAELKGFELKRRGELEIVKNMQSDLFPAFLDGNSLESCYDAVAEVANKWLDVLITKGRNLEDDDLITLIGERKSMSKSIDSYNGLKSTSITTVKRLVEFLGIEVNGNSGITAQFIIADRPKGAPVSERAIPIAIFSSDISQKRIYLRKWLKDNSLDDFDPRAIIDWSYYFERLASVVLKIISIPAYYQIKKNPCETVELPQWITKKINENRVQQRKLTSFFGEKTDKIGVNSGDIEDLAQSNTYLQKKGFVKSRKRKVAKPKITLEERDEEILATECPDPLQDYVGWLEYNKAIWRKNDLKKEANRQLFGSNRVNDSKLQGMLRDNAKSYANSKHWQVLQYKMGGRPGVVLAKVLIGEKIQEIKITVPKKVFVTMKNNKHVPKEFVPSKAIVPHNDKQVYKVEMNEEQFMKELKKPDSIFHDCAVYESHIDSKQRLVLELGTTVQFESKQMGGLYKGLQFGFQRPNLSRVINTPYLQNFQFNVVYLAHVSFNQYEIYTIFRSWDANVSMFVLKPGNKAHDLNVDLEKVYSDLYKKTRSSLDDSLIKYKHFVDIDLVQLTSMTGLRKQLNQKLSHCYEEKGTSCILAVQSPQFNTLCKTLKSMNDFPVVKLTFVEFSLPALNWQESLGKKLFTFYFSLARWIQDLSKLAYKSGVPLCNLELDDLPYLVDVEYARRLSNEGIVLWWSHDTCPDLGGAEKHSLVPVGDSMVFPSLNNPEVYDENVVIELELRNLTVNTILTSSLINQAEGADLAELDDTSITSDQFSRNSLGVLKNMVKDWWDSAVSQESSVENSEYFDVLFSNLMTWMQKKSSYLYDPELEYHIHNLSKKGILQIIKEFKKMGSSVVFTNRNKMLVKSPKKIIENSYAYSQYIVKTLRSQPLFHYLDISIVRYWDVLLWMNEKNFAGRAAFEVKEGAQDYKQYSQWQLAKYLPPIYQSEFQDWVGIFVGEIIKEKVASLDNDKENVSKTGTRFTGTSFSEEFDASVRSSTSVSVVWKPLKKRISKLYAKQNSVILSEAFSEEYKFPKLPGSHLKLTNPTLELVKSLCAVLGLSKSRMLEVRSLRRELLNQLDVREFSDESVFQDPSLSLKLPSVCCRSCGWVRDIDFCKDEDAWSCESCHTEFNKLALEESLIHEFKRYVALFYLQDLKCSKCGSIRIGEMDLFCRCSGKWTTVIPESDFLEKVLVFDNVADYYGLYLLKDIIATL